MSNDLPFTVGFFSLNVRRAAEKSCRVAAQEQPSPPQLKRNNVPLPNVFAATAFTRAGQDKRCEELSLWPVHNPQVRRTGRSPLVIDAVPQSQPEHAHGKMGAL